MRTTITLTLILAVMFFAACGSPPATRPDSPAPDPKEALASAGKPDIEIMAQDSEEGTKAAERLAKRMDEDSMLRQRNRAYAENYYKLGKQQYEKVQIEVAKENLKLALRYNPEHRQAAELLEKVQGMLGERASKVETFFKWSVKERKIKIQQRKQEIRNLLRKGKKLYEEKAYAEAADAFEEALMRIKTMPYDADMSAEKKEAKGGLERARK